MAKRCGMGATSKAYASSAHALTYRRRCQLRKQTKIRSLLVSLASDPLLVLLHTAVLGEQRVATE